jgi:hypothetical protein
MIGIKEDEVSTVVEWNFNGRQIKNVVAVAQVVAIERKTPITLETLRVAAEFAQPFCKVTEGLPRNPEANSQAQAG